MAACKQKPFATSRGLAFLTSNNAAIAEERGAPRQRRTRPADPPADSATPATQAVDSTPAETGAESAGLDEGLLPRRSALFTSPSRDAPLHSHGWEPVQVTSKRPVVYHTLTESGLAPEDVAYIRVALPPPPGLTLRVPTCVLANKMLCPGA